MRAVIFAVVGLVLVVLALVATSFVLQGLNHVEGYVHA